MSRASWYKHGKPTQKPRRLTIAERMGAFGLLLDQPELTRAAERYSSRTLQRMERVMRVPELTSMMLHHGWKPAQCERLLTNPQRLRKFLRDYRKSQKETKTVDVA